EASLDFVYSFIVFQHIPTKRAVARYLKEAGGGLQGEGIFPFQGGGRPRPAGAGPGPPVGGWYEAGGARPGAGGGGGAGAGALWGEGTHYLWATAIGEGGPGRPDPGAARLRRRGWARAALEALLARLDPSPRVAAEEVVSGRRSLRRTADRFLEENAGLSPEA